MATGLGIDVGSQWIKVVQVRCSGNSVTVTGALKIPRTGAPEGPDLPVDKQAGLLIPSTVGRELARAGLRRSGTLGLSGREVLLKYLATPPMPPAKLKMMIDLQVGERMLPGRKGSDVDAPPAITYDYRLLNVPTGLKGDLVVMAGVAMNEFLYGMHAGLRAGGVQTRRMTPAAFGLAQAYLRTQKITPGEAVVLVDVGHKNLELAILSEEHIYFARSAQGGGKGFDEALDGLLKLGVEKIREYKHHRARIYPDGAKVPSSQEQQFQAALKEVADVVAGAIRSAVMFCRTQAKMPKLDYQRIFLSGGGARLNGLREYLEQKTKRPVQVLDLYTGLDLRKLDAASARCFEGEIPDMAVALGLAVIDADPRCLHFQMLPEPILKRRIFWNRTVWAAAAGLVLIAGLVLPLRYSGKALAKAIEQKDDFVSRAALAKKMKADFGKRETAYHGLARKQEYYARQARLGQVYLNFFTKLRGHTPPGMTLNLVGPLEAEDRAASLSGCFEAPLRKLQIRGTYDSEVIKDFNRATGVLFEKLKEVPGVEVAELGETDKDPAPGLKNFSYKIFLANPDRPLLVTPATVDSGKKEPAPAVKP